MNKKIVWLFVILAAVVLLGRLTNGQTLSKVVYEEDELGFYLDKLAKCESGRREDVKILDRNNEYSYGYLQFQAETFISYALKYKLYPSAERSEILNYIFDSREQLKLARKMLEDDPKNIGNWKVCGRKEGIYKYLKVSEM